MPSPGPGRSGRATNSLRPGLREATNALLIANNAVEPPARPPLSSHPSGDGDREPTATDGRAQQGHDRDGLVHEDDEAGDDEGCALAELAQLLDALSETVAALALASRSSRRAHLRSLEGALTDSSARATTLSLDSRTTHRPALPAKNPATPRHQLG